MRDLVFVLLTVGFFAVAAAVVKLCDAMVGPDPPDLGSRGQAAAQDAELVSP